jgi:hypothetical protein
VQTITWINICGWIMLPLISLIWAVKTERVCQRVARITPEPVRFTGFSLRWRSLRGDLVSHAIWRHLPFLIAMAIQVLSIVVILSASTVSLRGLELVRWIELGLIGLVCGTYF